MRLKNYILITKDFRLRLLFNKSFNNLILRSYKDLTIYIY